MAARKVRRPVTNSGPLADRLNAGAPSIAQDEEVQEVELGKDTGQPVAMETGAAESASSESGDIAPGDVTEPAQKAVEDTTPRPWMDSPTKPRDGIIVGPGEPIRATGVVEGKQVILSQRIYRAHLMPKSTTWGFVLVYPRNHRLPLVKLTEVNGAKVENGVVTLAQKINEGETIQMPRPQAA